MYIVLRIDYEKYVLHTPKIIPLFHTIQKLTLKLKCFIKYAKCAPPYPPGPPALSMINI